MTSISMSRLLALVTLLTLISTTSSIAYAHFGIIISDKWLADIGEKVKIYYAFGHPFEHEIMSVDNVHIKEAYYVDPRGGKHTLSLSKYNDTFYVGELTCDVDGDYVIVIVAEAVHGHGGKQEITVDYAKTIVHCGAVESGYWNRPLGLPAEIVLLTRPYGLEAPTVVIGYVYSNGRPVANLRVEVEHYHGSRQEAETALNIVETLYKTYPDAYITKAVLTDTSGRFYASMVVPGVWLIGAELGERGGKIVRTSFTLYVAPPLEVQLMTKKLVSQLQKVSMRTGTLNVQQLVQRISTLESKMTSLEAKVRQITAGVPSWLIGVAVGGIILAIIALVIAGFALRRR